MRELEVDRERRIEIGEGLEHHRDAVVARARELIKFDFSHGLLQLPDKRERKAAQSRARRRRYELRHQRQGRATLAVPFFP
jgi:hypothetical protein